MHLQKFNNESKISHQVFGIVTREGVLSLVLTLLPDWKNKKQTKTNVILCLCPWFMSAWTRDALGRLVSENSNKSKITIPISPSVLMDQCYPSRSSLPSCIRLPVRFKDSVESETNQPSHIRRGPLRDESESRVGRLNSEETDSAENRRWLGRLDIMMIILCLIAIQCENNYISMYLWM